MSHAIGENHTNYTSFLEEIKSKIQQAQYGALKAVNKQLLDLYWDIGKMIYEKQEKEGWGKSIVENVAKDLQKEMQETRGFSASSLWRMRNFFTHYRDQPKLAPLVREIGWSHNIVIMEKCKDPLSASFYLKMCAKFGWSKNMLIHHIEQKTYERVLLGQNNFDKSLATTHQHEAKLAVKDSYIFNFLDLGEEHSEKELERSLTKKIGQFLSVMGGEYAYIGNQFKIKVGSQNFYIDLLLYHRSLKSLVVVELKSREFRPSDTGQLQFYLTTLDQQVKKENENPSIGILICKEKDRTVVEYSLKNTTSPIGVANYTVTHNLPHDLQQLLPSQEDIANIIDII